MNDTEFYEKAVEKYDEGDYDTAVVMFRKLASDGHSESQDYLDILYSDGISPSDYREDYPSFVKKSKSSSYDRDDSDENKGYGVGTILIAVAVGGLLF